MDTKTLVSDEVRIGEVFTPLKWALWLVDRWGLADRWIDGESICDPTAGEGVFAEALINIARSRGIRVSKELLDRLHLVELRNDSLENFASRMRSVYDIDFPRSSLHTKDVIQKPLRKRFDILVGNPPWSNFTDLPLAYKEVLKPYFLEYGLVPDRKAVLLGSARTDIAALVLKAILLHMLRDGGEGYFFVPLSLFTGDDAHTGFRDFATKGVPFSVKEVIEMTQENVFEGVGTSYCATHFVRDRPQTFPVPFTRSVGGNETQLEAQPLTISTDPWRVVEDLNTPLDGDEIDIHLMPNQKPRQGVNTCGANSSFIFSEYPEFIDPAYVFPLATKEVWKNRTEVPSRWIFMPYDSAAGKPMSLERAQQIEGFSHLSRQKDILEKRKGTLINTSIRKGVWWALLGVGPYSFAPFKVIWQAYGKHSFDPIVLGAHDGQPWQGNQAMHAFIPCWSEEDAVRICRELKNPRIEQLLKELNGQGKCNFAQPGKLKKLLTFNAESSEQMQLLEAETMYRTSRCTQRRSAP